MSELVADCPRCNAKAITFDVTSEHHRSTSYGWQRNYELFGICRACDRSTIFYADQTDANTDDVFRKSLPSKMSIALNRAMTIKGYLSQKDAAAAPPPEHLP